MKLHEQLLHDDCSIPQFTLVPEGQLSCQVLLSQIIHSIFQMFLRFQYLMCSYTAKYLVLILWDETVKFKTPLYVTLCINSSRFLYELSLIPQFSLRARCIIFQSTFTDAVASIQRKSNMVLHVCKVKCSFQCCY